MQERKLIREIHPLKSAKMNASWVRIGVGKTMWENNELNEYDLHVNENTFAGN